MDERGRTLQARVQFMERNGRALEELTAKMLRAREEQESFLGVFSKSLQDVAAQEDCRSLSSCFAALSESGQKLASDTHDVMLQRPEAEILHNISQVQDWGIIPIKVCSVGVYYLLCSLSRLTVGSYMQRLLEDRDKVLKIEAKLQKEYDELRVSRDVYCIRNCRRAFDADSVVPSRAERQLGQGEREETSNAFRPEASSGERQRAHRLSHAAV